ncbi:MAG: ubiquitin-like small modifier protein 1 [Acidimicrobiales bacterium]
MPVEVRLPTLLRPATGGRAKVSADGATVGEVLRSVISEHPALGAQVMTEDGELHHFLNVYVNDEDVRYLERLDTRVASNDVVSILPAVAGGAT